MHRFFSLAVAAIGLQVLAGCGSKGGGGSSQDASESLMGEMIELLHASEVNGKGPASVNDLARQQSKFPRAFGAAKAGDIVVLWGATMLGEGAASSPGQVIAYEKDAPTAGGTVLLTNGKIQKMSAAEFGSAPKAGKK